MEEAEEEQRRRAHGGGDGNKNDEKPARRPDPSARPAKDRACGTTTS